MTRGEPRAALRSQIGFAGCEQGTGIAADRVILSHSQAIKASLDSGRGRRHRTQKKALRAALTPLEEL